MSVPFPEPTQPMATGGEVLVAYLDHFRSRAIDKVSALPEHERSTSHVPSGWTPVQLLRHLTFMERRWVVWGFLGEDVGDPWGDERDGRWTEGEQDLAATVRELRAQGARSAAVIRSHDLAAVGAPSPRWDGAAPAPLGRVVLHVLQEYARHLGQLDVAVELATGAVGE